VESWREGGPPEPLPRFRVIEGGNRCRHGCGGKNR
jgi:hypothetical protein